MCGIWGLHTSKTLVETNKYYEAFMKLKHRGPEFSSFNFINNNLLLGFHRLAIIDTSPKGNQPFTLVSKNGSYIYAICNGEIYNYKQLIDTYQLPVTSNSDCEVIIHLYDKVGINKMTTLLDGEFVYLLVEISLDGDIILYAGRDAIGVRPLFYAQDRLSIGLSSEAKGLINIYTDIKVFPPGHYLKYQHNNLQLTNFYSYNYNEINNINDVGDQIRNKLIKAVGKRLITDRPFGCLLSGGLDSSLVCAIAKLLLPNTNFPVFTISFPGGTDLPYAQLLAQHLNLDHYVINIDPKEALKEIDETIYAIESYDITTIRASTMQRIIGKWIQENTKVRVVLVGENSDELFQGYRYFVKQPSCQEGHSDSIRLVKDIHMFDGLRTDRTMAYHGLEVRLPFTDTNLVDYVFSLPSELVMPFNGIEKYLLRQSCQNLLPDSILYRTKEALSDGVSTTENSWYNIIQRHIDSLVTDEEYLTNKDQFKHNTPYTKESYYYRKKFVEYFGNGENVAKLIPYFWLPRWCENATDPSARTLSVYNH